jgi:hypothetical protein
LLGSLVLYPYAENSTFAYYAFRVLASTAIVLGFYAVSFRRSLIVICHPRVLYLAVLISRLAGAYRRPVA